MIIQAAHLLTTIRPGKALFISPPVLFNFTLLSHVGPFSIKVSNLTLFFLSNTYSSSPKKRLFFSRWIGSPARLVPTVNVTPFACDAACFSGQKGKDQQQDPWPQRGGEESTDFRETWDLFFATNLQGLYGVIDIMGLITQIIPYSY